MQGAFITTGVREWQIFQQNEHGFAKITVSGTWEAEGCENPNVFLTVKREDTMEPIIWWKRCERENQEWHVDVEIPAGGLYMVETCLVKNDDSWSEWALRGDIVSHIGVGDLYVIAGQSNSAGYGKDYIYDPCEMGVHILKNDREWHLAQHPLQDSSGAENPVNADEGNVGHSLYLAFAKYLKRDLNYPIGLIQTSQGGTGIDTWLPGNRLYLNMFDRINDAGGKVKGIVWYQGCTDCREDKCKLYEEKFIQFRKAVIEQLGAKTIPFFVFQLNRNCALTDGQEDVYWGTVREQQRRLSALDNTYVIPTTDCVLSDFVHNSAKANCALGERLAKTVLTHTYGKNYLCDAPNIKSVKKVEDDTVIATFENVYDKLELFWCEGKKLAFTAEDENGVADVSEYELKAENEVRLRFERNLSDNAVLHGAYTKNLGQLIPFDFATHLPMLSFYGINIEK